MSDFDIALQRLTAWVRDYGDAKPRVFIGDLTLVLMAAKESYSQAAEIDRLRQFRDRVLSAMTEHAGGQADFAYIWQSEWDRIKSECGEPVERKDGGK